MSEINIHDIDLTKDDDFIELKGEFNFHDFTPYDVIGKAFEFDKSVQARNIEFNKYHKTALRLFYDTFIATATSRGLKKYEEMLEILNPPADLEERRKLVFAVWNVQTLWTHRTLEDWLNSYLGENAYNLEIIYNNYQLIFEVKIENINKDTNIPFLEKKLRQIISANLGLRVDSIITPKIYVGSVCVTGEETTIYPYVLTEISTNIPIYVGSANAMGYEIIEIMPKGAYEFTDISVNVKTHVGSTNAVGYEIIEIMPKGVI